MSDRLLAGREDGRRSHGRDRLRARQHAGPEPRLGTRDALDVVGCAPIFEERASGARTERPGLAEAFGCLREGDVLVVWRLDRLGRSLLHLIGTVGALEARGGGFRSLTEAIDTMTPSGRLTFHLFGALGPFERDLIRERTCADLAAAAARGRKGGRTPVVTPEKPARARSPTARSLTARSPTARGLTVRDAAARLRIGKSALCEALRPTPAPE